MLRAAAYARKSNVEEGKEADRKSVAHQIAEARRYAEGKGWRWCPEHAYQDDAISGAEFQKRPGLTRLLDAVKGKRLPFDVLIVSERSRLGRDTFRSLALIQALEDAGLQVWAYLDDSRVTLDSDTDEVNEFMRAWAGSQERRKAGQRSRSVKARDAKEGRPTGNRLYGYLPDLTVIPAQADVVRRIFKLRAEGMGFFRIARALERDGIEPPRKGKHWNVSQVAAITRNETYRGVRVWGQTMRVKRRGTVEVVEAPAATVIRAERPDLRLVDDALWQEVQRVNEAATAGTWRNERGRLKSRPTSSRWLLNPFLSCALCGGSMHAKQSGKHWRYVCSRRHLNGAKACSNARGLNVEHADRAILKQFEEALVGQVVLAQLEQALDEHKRRAQDPEPLKAEAAKLKREVSNLVNALAAGDLDDVHDAIRARKARLEHLEGTLQGLGVAALFDVAEFAKRVLPVIADWQAHLKKNTSTAQQVLRKILPEKIKATPGPEGSWTFDMLADYSAVLKEVGLDAISAILQEVKVSGSRARRGWRRAPSASRLPAWAGHSRRRGDHPRAGRTPGR